MVINNYKQLKEKIQVGNSVLLTYYVFTNGNTNDTIAKRLNKMRLVVKKQSNGIKFDDESWLGFGMFGEKVSNFLFFGNNKFTFRNDWCVLDYQVMDN